MAELSIEEARDHLLSGGRVRMVVGGHDPEDPVLELRNEDGMIVSTAVAGWSEGIEEPVCEESSDFLRGYLSDHKLEAIEDDQPDEETVTLTITQAEAHALFIECSCCNTSEEGMTAWRSLNSKNYEAMKARGWL